MIYKKKLSSKISNQNLVATDSPNRLKIALWYLASLQKTEAQKSSVFSERWGIQA